jgi:histidinol-phosphate aminotransferase
VPTFRRDLESIRRLSPDTAVDEAARDLGMADAARLALNENPQPPFPEVIAAMAAASSTANRYPDDGARAVAHALAHKHAVSPDHIWVGAGSTQLLSCIALAAGGPGTSAVFADPSFPLYRFATVVAGAHPVAVPCDDVLRHDLDAMADAVRADTTVVYVCSPNNPTGTYVAGEALWSFVAGLPDRVLLVVDEAYAEYATAPDYATLLARAISRPNVVVTRTFSKIYGLAGLRIGYALGQPATLRALRKVQPPFSVSSVAQAAATAALAHDARLSERVEANAAGRAEIEASLTRCGLEFASSQANFVLFMPDADPHDLAEAMLQEGVIVRPIGPWVRVTVGSAPENARFGTALERALAALAR